MKFPTAKAERESTCRNIDLVYARLGALARNECPRCRRLRERRFKAGMIYTNEPGIYIRGDALDYLPDTPANKEFLSKVRTAFEKYKNTGIRIEDDMLVTNTGVEWMTKNLPRSIADIEAFMARASKEMCRQ